MNRGGMQFQPVVPFTKAVKALVIANVAIWIVGVLIIQGMILRNGLIIDLFGLVPTRVVHEFWLWQIFSYMFFHSFGVFHILFNMLVLWWFGAELEMRWGTRFFTTYYFVCGVGAGLIYVTGTTVYALFTGNVLGMTAPLVGASGATYGLLLAYGLLFGERIIYFMMLFPMKAKYFTMIIGAIELFTMMDSGQDSRVANLAHLGGLVVGFLFLTGVARWRSRKASGGGLKRGRRLKLVVDNERNDVKQNDRNQGPKYWN